MTSFTQQNIIQFGNDRIHIWKPYCLKGKAQLVLSKIVACRRDFFVFAFSVKWLKKKSLIFKTEIVPKLKKLIIRQRIMHQNLHFVNLTLKQYFLYYAWVKESNKRKGGGLFMECATMSGGTLGFQGSHIMKCCLKIHVDVLFLATEHTLFSFFSLSLFYYFFKRLLSKIIQHSDFPILRFIFHHSQLCLSRINMCIFSL